MARTDPHFKLRIPDDLLAELKDVAESNGRSVTAEIVQRLRHSLLARDLMVNRSKHKPSLDQLFFPDDVMAADAGHESKFDEKLAELSDEKREIIVAVLEKVLSLLED